MQFSPIFLPWVAFETTGDNPREVMNTDHWSELAEITKHLREYIPRNMQMCNIGYLP